jgi:endoglucanase
VSAADRPESHRSSGARNEKKRAWKFCYWRFDYNFMVYDIDKNAWDEPNGRALVPR